MIQVEEATRRRQLEAVDMFLETARSHLRTLSTGTGDEDGQDGGPPSALSISGPTDYTD